MVGCDSALSQKPACPRRPAMAALSFARPLPVHDAALSLSRDAILPALDWAQFVRLHVLRNDKHNLALFGGG
jgi:hypothetical protein